MQAISIPDLKVTVINVYRPFGDMALFFNTLESNLTTVIEKSPLHDIIMVGDFNVDIIKSSTATDNLIDLTLSKGLMQQVTLPTRVAGNSKTLIDHVYTKSKKTLKTDVVMSTISDHYSTLTRFLSVNQKRKKLKVTKRWFNENSYIDLATILAGTDWQPMEAMNCENSAIYLEDRIKEAMDIVAPIESKTIKNKVENQWTTLGIRTSLETAAKLYSCLLYTSPSPRD